MQVDAVSIWHYLVDSRSCNFSSTPSLILFLFILIMQVSDSDSLAQQHSVTSSAKMFLGSTASKQNQRPEGSGRIIRRILSNKDLRHSQSSRPHSEQQSQTSSHEKEKRPPRPSHVHLILKGTNGTLEDKTGVNDLHVSSERQETHVRHKDRADRSVWTNFSNGADDALSSSASSQIDSRGTDLFYASNCLVIGEKGEKSENPLCLNLQLIYRRSNSSGKSDTVCLCVFHHNFIFMHRLHMM